MCSCKDPLLPLLFELLLVFVVDRRIVTHTPHKISMKDCHIAVALAAAAISLLLPTMHPSLGDGDNPELVFRSKLFVPAHPPGYPLLMLIGKGADLLVELVCDTVVFAYCGNKFVFQTFNTIAVLLSAATIGFMFMTSRNLGLTRGMSIASSFLFVFAPHVRNYATQFEVFSLNNLLLSMLLWTATKFDAAPTDSARRNSLAIGAFIAGLAMSNQHTSILFIIPIAIWVVLRWPRGALRYAPLTAMCIAVGLLPYMVLPLSMRASTQWLFTAWGATNTWQGFVAHFLRADYGTFTLSPQMLTEGMTSTMLRNWRLYGDEVAAQTLQYLWVAAPLGLLWGLSSFRGRSTDESKGCSPSLWAALGLAFVLYNAVINTLSNLDVVSNPVKLEVQRRFWFQPLMPLVLAIGAGLSIVTRKLSSSRWVDLLIGAAIAFAQVSLHWADYSNAYVLEDFSRMIIDSLPHGAILVAEGDAPYFGASAVAYAMRERLDLLIISSTFLFSPFFRENFERSTGLKLPGERYGNGPRLFNNAQLLERWISRDKKRVFFVGSQFTHPGDQSHAESFAIRYMGIVNEFIPQAVFDRIGSAAMSDPLPDAHRDWEKKASALGPYVKELFSVLPMELPRSFIAADRHFSVDTWEAEVLTNLKSLLSTNAEQLLAFASYDDPQKRDVTLPQTTADIVSSNSSTVTILQDHPTSTTPIRYKMLVVARTLLQNNRRLALVTRTGGGVDELLMFRVLQQMMRFHLCSDSGHPPQNLFDEIASVATAVLDEAKRLGVQDGEDFSKREVLDYMVWLKRRLTRPNPDC